MAISVETVQVICKMSCVTFLDTHSELLRKVEVGELKNFTSSVALALTDETYDGENSFHDIFDRNYLK